MNTEEMEKKEKIFEVAKNAVISSRQMRKAGSSQKKDALVKIAELLESKADDIKFRNEIDVEAAREDGLPEALIDRLILDDKRIKSMTDGIREVAEMEDPVGQIIEEREGPGGLKIRKVRVPLGVIAMVYESRPNVTADAAALCLKSSNSVILRGGSEALNSNLAIGHFIQEALSETELPAKSVQVVEDTDRELVNHLISLKGMVDIVIPRGSEKMIETITEKSKIPVIGHGKGLCHIYIDETADGQKAADIVFNAKVQRPGVCNAVETLLVHSSAAGDILPGVLKKLEDAGVELVGDERAKDAYEMQPASKEDWASEYLGLKLSVKVVDSVREAVEHIERFGSHHSDAIITEDKENCGYFLNNVDSACVYCNASTRFTDGSQMGLGAEIGISNQKLHARGPMGVRELTTYKYHMIGTGQVRT